MKQWALAYAMMDREYTSIEAAFRLQEEWRGQHSGPGPSEDPEIESPDGLDHRPVNYIAAAQFFTMYKRWKTDERRKLK